MSVAPRLLRGLRLRGHVVTGDALYCQRALCRLIRRKRGHYLLAVKANQPDLYADLALLFESPPPGEVFVTHRSRSWYADRHEVRLLTASAALRGYLDWPGHQQVLRVVREVRSRCPSVSGGVAADPCLRDVRYFVTSLPATGAQALRPDHLLDLVRRHWHIENRLHYVRDVTLGEDASAIRSGSAPQVLAALRNAVLGLLRHAHWRNIAAAIRHYTWLPQEAFRLLGLPVPHN